MVHTVVFERTVVDDSVQDDSYATRIKCCLILLGRKHGSNTPSTNVVSFCRGEKQGSNSQSINVVSFRRGEKHSSNTHSTNVSFRRGEKHGSNTHVLMLRMCSYRVFSQLEFTSYDALWLCSRLTFLG